MNALKNITRKTLRLLHIDITGNLKYDRYTEKIMKKVIKPGCNCVDVGCHKGEIMEMIIKLSPKGHHMAFEPVPYYYHLLKSKFNSNVTVFPYALSDHAGFSEFQFVRNAPAYSGLKKRDYKVIPDIETLEVELKTLDEIVNNKPVHFIKIDVEGGEFDVLKGSLNTLRINKPIIIFEFGLGASNHYEATPDDLYDLLNREAGMRVSLLRSFLKNGPELTKDSFISHYHNGREYYFTAHP